MDLAIKSQRLESIIILLLAEYPVTAAQFRRIEDFIGNIEPRVMASFGRCLAKAGHSGGEDGIFSVLYIRFRRRR